jgi:hypothetical protein
MQALLHCVHSHRSYGGTHQCALQAGFQNGMPACLQKALQAVAAHAGFLLLLLLLLLLQLSYTHRFTE